jgi:hypothetical protein
MKILKLLMWLTIVAFGYELTWLGKGSLTYVLLFILICLFSIMYYLTNDEL